MDKLKLKVHRFLRWSEKYTKTDMIYAGRSGFWLVLGQIVGTLSAFILTVIFANYLSKEVFGVYKYILSTTGFLAVFSLTGMNTVVTRAVAQGYDGTFKYSLLLQLKWTLPQFLLLFILATYYFLQGNVPFAIAFLIASVFGPISTVANTFNTFLHGKQDFRTATFYNISSTVFYIAFMLVTTFFFPQAVWLVAIYFISNALANIFFCFRTLKKYPPQNPTLRVGDVTYAKHLSVMNIIGSASQQIDNIIVYHLLGPVQLAIFSFSTILPDRIRTVFNTLASAALPKLSEKHGGGWISLKFKMKQLGILAVLIITLYIFIAPYLYNLFFPEYISSILYSQVYILSLLLLPTYISVPSLLATQQKKALYILSTILPIIKVFISFLFILFWGVIGAIVARIVHNILYLVLSLHYVRLNKTPHE